MFKKHVSPAEVADEFINSALLCIFGMRKGFIFINPRPV